MFSGEVPILQNICHIQKEAEVFALVLADCSLRGWEMKALRVSLRSSQLNSLQHILASLIQYYDV